MYTAEGIEMSDKKRKDARTKIGTNIEMKFEIDTEIERIKIVIGTEIKDKIKIKVGIIIRIKITI